MYLNFFSIQAGSMDVMTVQNVQAGSMDVMTFTHVNESYDDPVVELKAMESKGDDPVVFTAAAEPDEIIYILPCENFPHKDK